MKRKRIDSVWKMAAWESARTDSAVQVYAASDFGGFSTHLLVAFPAWWYSE